ncbi:hypothetical protein NBE98_08050 [Clostridium swellfunianum]|uniref:hypothetical protein n=1 Tax=Clostridium swellfunianum TaxID=1367462 RepID=UPI00202F2474|nr:hypothetical protein [Clostridium swellfunianum]MCM0648325.1 hypothetical protein [Clostridium swellfunianum]
MSQNKEAQKAAQQRENERRVDQLINLVENKTRTERHLEQHSDIGDPDRLDHAHEVQHDRENQIEDIKNAIVYGDNTKNDTQDQLQSLKKNYTFSQGYIDHNADHMDPQALENLQKKQDNRKEQMDTLE